MESFTLDATVAATTETSLGTKTISANQRWKLHKIAVDHPQGGTFKITSKNITDWNYEAMQTGLTPTNAQALDYLPLGVEVSNDELEVKVTNDAATSGTGRATVIYERLQ